MYQNAWQAQQGIGIGYEYIGPYPTHPFQYKIISCSQTHCSKLRNRHRIDLPIRNPEVSLAGGHLRHPKSLLGDLTSNVSLSIYPMFMSLDLGVFLLLSQLC